MIDILETIEADSKEEAIKKIMEKIKNKHVTVWELQ